MEVTNDNGCSWIKDLIPRTNIKTLKSNDDCEWLIIGAGYTGLSAARKLGQLYPNQKIILVDSQLAGEGASSRNSGYLVDTTLNDGFTSNKELDNYKKKTDIYDLGIQVVKKFINEHQVDCDWNECGKYFASSKKEDEKILRNCRNELSNLLKIKFENHQRYTFHITLAYILRELKEDEIKKLLKFNKNLFKEFDKEFPKIVLDKPEMSTFENMLEFKSVNQIL